MTVDCVHPVLKGSMNSIAQASFALGKAARDAAGKRGQKRKADEAEPAPPSAEPVGWFLGGPMPSWVATISSPSCEGVHWLCSTAIDYLVSYCL